MKKIYFLFVVVLFCVSGKAQIINFPDANFKAKLLLLGTATDVNGIWFPIDSNGNGEVDQSEAANIYKLDLYNANITDLSGIEFFVGLRELYCPSNNLTQLSIGSLTNLVKLTCGQNPLQSLDLTGLNNLKEVQCHWTMINNFTLCDCPNLETFGLSQSQLTTFSIANRPNLTYLNLGHNELVNLQITNCDNLEMLWIRENHLSDLDFNSFPNLETLNVMYNLFTTLDVSSLTHLTTFYASGNYLATSLNIKNGSMENNLEFDYISNLHFVCADDSQIDSVLSLASQYQYADCVINSYCSFTSGGVTYDVGGETRYDFDNNGCSNTDLIYPSLRLSVTDGVNSGGLIANASGNYMITVPAGNYTIAPILENPTYFTTSPASLIVDFPIQTSPVQQNFCITPNGIHHDLEITLLPQTVVRPGFDVNYKIIYKNKGTQTQSGTISFTFNDAVLDLINANPIVSSQAINALNWNFTDLQPFESREIALTLNANSPMEIPPVNGGDILNFTASANSSLTDETPDDNTFNLNQTVVNSFDPNDKTCLEGSTITPEMVGKDVHYMIRFENTGTANAENVVVKDMIDMTKFDINSLIPVDGSHPFVTRITNTNKVEFIFENINLPFDDANNDGYVAFKIKTKPTLVVGDSFSNTASIYFDYNFPIITNTATTTLALLANSDFEFENYFSIYPNPANDVLNIETKQTIAVTSINIYNTLGQVVLVIPNAQQTKSVDVSSLKTGNYLMKVNSDKGSSSVKFVKL
ncbi:MAG: T9SS type A sorting domain-containing protein [Flavobacterium sp.]|nr:T9SS type A sorting domain-containing protein [Flavobacterium sp.]